MKPRPLFAGAVSLAGAALLFEGDGTPALYFAAHTKSARVKLFRLPSDVHLYVKMPSKLPSNSERTLHGGHVTFEREGVRQDLALNTVGVCRELLEAVESHAQSLKAWQAARATFEGEEGAA